MRDGVMDGTVDLRHALAPAEGLDPATTLFASPPIESLEMLKELGEIARLSLEPATVAPPPVETPAAIAPTRDASPGAAAVAPKAAPPNSDAQLMEALLEYHRLRGPTLGARTAPQSPHSGANGFARADASSIPGERFSPVDIPVVSDFEPKTSTSPFHAKHPVHSILRPKKRP